MRDQAVRHTAGRLFRYLISSPFVSPSKPFRLFAAQFRSITSTEKTLNSRLLAELRNAESATWAALANPTTDTLIEIHGLIGKALRIAEGQAFAPRCEAPSCTNAVEYGGVGRPRRYCCDRCRKRAHRAAGSA